MCLLQPSQCAVKLSSVRQADWWVIKECERVCVSVYYVHLFLHSWYTKCIYLTQSSHSEHTHHLPGGRKDGYFHRPSFSIHNGCSYLFLFFSPFNLRWHFTSDICYYVYCFKHIFIMALIWCIFSNTDPTGVFCFSFHCHVSSSDLTLAASLLWDLKLWDLPQLNYVLFTYRHGNTYIWCSEHSKLYTVRCQASESNFLSHFMWSRFSAAHTV